MAEGAITTESTSQGLGRRDFLKKMASVAATAGLSNLVSSEVTKGSVGVMTETGVFTPLYERHDVGINVNDIPKDTHIYFREVNGEGFLDKRVPKDILQGKALAYKGSPKQAEIRAFSNELLTTLANMGAEAMVGDVEVGRYYSVDRTEWSFIVAALRGLGAGVSALLLSSLKDLKVSRREFVKGFGLLLGLWSLGPIFSNMFGDIGNSTKEQNALKRISSRLEGMSSNFHLEEVGVFFRNLVMADKMLTVASEMKATHKGMLPRLAFQVEGGHSGIEDFLQAGPEICRTLILAYPKPFLKEIVDLNGGVEQFCTSRLFKLPRIFLFTEGGEIPEETSRRITERRVIDFKLKEQLEKIFA